MENHKILVSAYGCEPFRGSEAGVGWNWVIQMANNNELYVIVRRNDRKKIEDNIPQNVKENLHFCYYDAPKFFLNLKKREKGLYFYYFIWQLGIKKIVKKLKSEVKFDYCMHLSFGSFWMPTFLPSCGIPFIWGPVGGGDSVHKNYLKEFPTKQRWIQKMRQVLIKTAHLNPMVRKPSKKAIAIILRTENNIEVIPQKYRNKIHIMLETAMEDEIFKYSKITRNDDIIEIIATGRFVPTKNTMSMVEVINNLKDKYKIHMTIVGKGPDREKIEKKIKEYEIENYISIIKEMPRQEVMSLLAKSDIYFFPSLKEGGSWALMEAMAIGLPVVCLNWTGMNIITDEQSAIRIEPTNYLQSNKDFTNALEKLIANKLLREEMGKAGRQRIVDEFCWTKKGKFMEQLLKELDEDDKTSR